jgi:hypothetical protein
MVSYFAGKIYIFGGRNKNEELLQTIELYSLTTGGNVLYKMIYADAQFAAVAVSL